MVKKVVEVIKASKREKALLIAIAIVIVSFLAVAEGFAADPKTAGISLFSAIVAGLISGFIVIYFSDVLRKKD